MELKILGIINRGLIEKKKNIKIPYYGISHKIVKLLYKEGYIFNYKINYNCIIVENHIKEGKLVSNGIKIYKKLKIRSYIKYKELNKIIIKKNKRYIISTTNGICTSNTALKYKLGGLVLGEIK